MVLFLDHITKIFGKRVVAVDDLTLKLEKGVFMGLLGPSGCGKTTTLRIVAGLEKPTKGKVYINNKDVTELPAEERNVSLAFQFPVIYPMSVSENIAFPLRVRKWSEADINARVKEIAEFMGISELLTKYPSQLTLAEKQKVALARAFAREADIYMLDEPLSAVDPFTRMELRRKLREAKEKFGYTIIYVTHDQAEAMTLCDVVAVMSEGRLLQYDTPANIYSRPAHTFVAWFIGNPGMNLIESEVESSNGELSLLLGKVVKYSLEEYESQLAKLVGKKVIFGIRPEDIAISTKKVEGKEWVPSVCSLIEGFSANLMIVHAKIGDSNLRVKCPIMPLKEGQEIWLHLPKSKISLFDQETKRRIF